MEPDVEDVDDSDSQQPESTREFCAWDTKSQAMRFAGVSEPVSIAEFKAKCVRHVRESIEGEGIAHKLSSIPPGPVRDFGFTEMLGVSLEELKAVQEECK